MTPVLFLLAFPPLLLLCAPVSIAKWQYDPSPNPKSVVTAGKARFTVLTDRIVRMEWGGPVDAATWGVLNRNLPTPSFEHSVDRGVLTITTESLKLRYSTAATTTFDSSNLRVSFMLEGYTVTWSPQPATQQAISGNLYGTFRTLDGNNGTNEPLNCYKNSRADLHCTLGLVSRHGYVVVDETYRPQFTPDPSWPWVTTANVSAPTQDMCSIDPADRLACGGNPIDVGQFDCNGRGCCYDAKPASGAPFCYYSKQSYQDLYFFAHGHDYKGALMEFTMLSGKIPIPPRYAFGIFYSRYWAYNDIEEMDIVKNYEQRGIPLDVLVTDMDWHKTFYKEAAAGKKDQANQTIGWTGFTWDPALFPQPKKFLDWCKAYGLKNTLNLHPASGIQTWEEKYPEMAEAMGIDPSTQDYVPFHPTNRTFVKNLFQIVLGEREMEGVDFWWLDWQQGEDWIKMPGVNPTFWLNYLFFTSPYHWNGTAPKLTRPLLLHRWGGLGNHRYQTGFSGDVMPSWTSLRFQVYFTVAATNVGFGYWSHDIGGHLEYCPPELYTRWIQWGAFSPMFRTHCTKNADNFRRIWLYPAAYYPVMRSFMRLREAMVPYIYTQARTAHDTGLSLIRGMYYDYPEESEAYTYQDSQYLFGDKLLVAPVTSPNDTTTGLTAMEIWIPEGAFVSWFSGEVIKGPQVIQRSFALYEMPVFAKAGAVVPMRTGDIEPIIGSAQLIPTSLKLMTFIGGIAASGSGSVYEDDGHTIAYQDNAYTTQNFSYSIKDTQLTFTITATTMPGVLSISTRSYQICLHGYLPATAVNIDGVDASYTPLKGPVYPSNTWTYDGSSLMLIITTGTLDLTKDHVVTVTTAKSPLSSMLQTNYVGLLQRFLNAKQLLDDQWGIQTVYQEEYTSLLLATETGVEISYNYAQLESKLSVFQNYTQEAISQVQNLASLRADVKRRVLALLQNK